jgi:hypothetical protein
MTFIGLAVELKMIIGQALGKEMMDGEKWMIIFPITERQ